MEIHVLPEVIANQIAAGEVIERPVNVVKELLENSLDAHAKSIDIQFRNGGISYIRISDDGDGMDVQDALLCFQRHATSKLQKIEDIYTLQSFGFRGEALPSIASISKINLQTCRRGESIGTEIDMSGGIIRHQGPCARTPGTTFTVEQLFFNLPVRRKFLKSEATESTHIVNCVRLYALSYPKIYFTLTEDRRQIFASPTCKSLTDRIDEIWPRRSCKHWIPLQFSRQGIEITGLICPPGYGYASAQEVYIFLNKRPIASLFLLGVIRESYRNYLPPKSYPAVFLFIHLPEKDVDINVHPSKREVRFKNEQALRQAVLEALSNTLKANASPTTDALLNESWPPSQSFCNTPLAPKPDVHASFIKEANVASNNPKAPSFLLHTAPESHPSTFIRAVAKEPQNQRTEGRNASPSPLKFLTLWQKHYALYETDAYLLFFDCQQANARICYEESLKNLQKSRLCLQKLLFPHTFTLSQAQTELLKANISFLNDKNICSLRHLKNDQFLLEALPACIDFRHTSLFIDQLLLELSTYGTLQNQTQWAENTARMLARQVNVTDLTETKIEYLRQRLAQCDNTTTGPEGQLIWHPLSLSDLKNLTPH